MSYLTQCFLSCIIFMGIGLFGLSTAFSNPPDFWWVVHGKDYAYFRLRSLDADKQGLINCSATLLRPPHINGEEQACRLVTNYHCIKNKAAGRIIDFPEAHMPEKVLIVEVVKSDPHRDLAELSLPDSIAEVFCKGTFKNLEPIQFWDKDYIMNKEYNSVKLYNAGFFNNRRFNNYSGNSTPPFMEFSEVILERAGLPGLDHFYRVNNLSLAPGMSGGPTILGDHVRLAGISTRFIPFHDTSFFIPNEAVVDFLNAPASQKTALAKYIYNQGFTAEYRFAGDGGHADGGDGGHADGGDGGHADGGGGRVDSRFKYDPLKAFREHEDGVVVPASKGKKIVAINGHQVDGMDDYKVLTERYEGQEQEIIFADPDTKELPLVVRKNIFERLLSGKRQTVYDSWNNPKWRMDRGFKANIFPQSRILYKDWQSPMGWKPVYYGHVPIEITFKRVRKRKKYKINYYHEAHDYMLIGSPLHIPVIRPANRLEREFIVDFSEDYKTVYLGTKEFPRSFTCENRYYAKLICKSINRKYEISFSLTDKDKGVLQVRQSIIAEYGEPGFDLKPGESIVQHFYGTIYRR